MRDKGSRDVSVIETGLLFAFDNAESSFAWAYTKEYKGRWKGPAESDPCPHDSFNVFLSIVSNYRVCKF